MTDADRSNVDSDNAERLWAEYQRQHDVSEQVGQTVGVDVRSGRLWFGESITDVVAQRDADGIDSLLFFFRIGSETYLRKGARL